MIFFSSYSSGWRVLVFCQITFSAFNVCREVSAFSLLPTVPLSNLATPRTVSASFVGRRNCNINVHFCNAPYNKRMSLFSSGSDEEEAMLSDIKAMRVKELKVELKSLGIGTEDAFEKEELVQRLFKARKEGRVASSSDGTTATTTTKTTAQTAASPPSSTSILSVPLTFRSLDSFRSVDASNSEEVFVRPSPGQFATLRADLPNGKYLTLLVDTACSGVVLRPSSVRNLGIPTFKAPGSMTAAGGTVGNTEVAQINQMIIAGNSFGPMPAAVQDIGALPSVMDGIIGLSFLNQFACVDIDFANGKLILDKGNANPPIPGGLSIISAGTMKLARIGIWIADVTFDGRSPVKMLVDTGAAATLFNWKGISDLGLSRNSPEISLNTNVGAVGADNVALRLTHRYVLNRSFNFEGTGVDLEGDTVNIDIGDIPVLDVLKGEGVGGILGADLFMKCDVVRLNLSGGSGKIALFKQTTDQKQQEQKQHETPAQNFPSADTAAEEPVAKREKKKKRQQEQYETPAQNVPSVDTAAEEPVAKKEKKKKRRTYD